MGQNFLHRHLFSPVSIIPQLRYIIQYNIHVLAAALSGWNQHSFQGPTAYPSSDDDDDDDDDDGPDAVGFPKRRFIWTTWRVCQPERVSLNLVTVEASRPIPCISFTYHRRYMKLGIKRVIK